MLFKIYKYFLNSQQNWIRNYFKNSRFSSSHTVFKSTNIFCIRTIFNFSIFKWQTIFHCFEFVKIFLIQNNLLNHQKKFLNFYEFVNILLICKYFWTHEHFYKLANFFKARKHLFKIYIHYLKCHSRRTGRWPVGWAGRLAANPPVLEPRL